MAARASWAWPVPNLTNWASGKFPSSGWRRNLRRFICRSKSEPLRLGLNHPAVKLLQRIRDECHRVANSLQRAIAPQENLRERAGRISRHRRAAQGGVAEKIRLSPAAAIGHAGTNRRRPRFRRQGGGGVEKISRRARLGPALFKTVEHYRCAANCKNSPQLESRIFHHPPRARKNNLFPRTGPHDCAVCVFPAPAESWLPPIAGQRFQPRPLFFSS